MQKIIDAFKQIGANAVLSILKPGISPNNNRGFQISVREDRKKHDSCFELFLQMGTKINVQDVNVKGKALLLKTSWVNEENKTIHEEFLCGRDDHGWFVSTLWGHSYYSVEEAVVSLRPKEITQELHKKKVPRSQQNKHRNAAFIRQGEWFFIPMNPDFVPSGTVREKERLGTQGKPHIADYVCSRGAVRYLHPNYREPLTWEQVSQLTKQGETGFRQVFQVVEAYAKGRVVHPDHKTIVLNVWHRVVPNTENRLPNSNAFID